jgi:hypothetical protein
MEDQRALDGGVWSTPRPGRLSPGKDTRYQLYRRLGGPQGQSERVRKISPPAGIRSPDRPACSESLYRLSYPATPHLPQKYKMHDELKINRLRNFFVGHAPRSEQGTYSYLYFRRSMHYSCRIVRVTTHQKSQVHEPCIFIWPFETVESFPFFVQYLKSVRIFHSFWHEHRWNAKYILDSIFLEIFHYEAVTALLKVIPSLNICAEQPWTSVLGHSHVWHFIIVLYSNWKFMRTSPK